MESTELCDPFENIEAEGIVEIHLLNSKETDGLFINCGLDDLSLQELKTSKTQIVAISIIFKEHLHYYFSANAA